MTFTSPFLEQLKAARRQTLSAAPVPPRPAKGVTVDDALMPPDPFTLGATPGHCASCRRWTYDGQGFMGECSAGRAAHGWLDGYRLAPVNTSAHLGCQAYGGKGWQARRGQP